jgi:hypothetical protein
LQAKRSKDKKLPVALQLEKDEEEARATKRE